MQVMKHIDITKLQNNSFLIVSALGLPTDNNKSLMTGTITTSLNSFFK